MGYLKWLFDEREPENISYRRTEKLLNRIFHIWQCICTLFCITMTVILIFSDLKYGPITFLLQVVLCVFFSYGVLKEAYQNFKCDSAHKYNSTKTSVEILKAACKMWPGALAEGIIVELKTWNAGMPFYIDVIIALVAVIDIYIYFPHILSESI